MSRKDFGVSIRVIWPKFFLMVLFTGLACLISLGFAAEPSVLQFVIAGGTAALSAFCYAIIPATNRATDRGDDAQFKRLHLVSVLLTVTVLLGNIGFLFT